MKEINVKWVLLRLLLVISIVGLIAGTTLYPNVAGALVAGLVVLALVVFVVAAIIKFILYGLD